MNTRAAVTVAAAGFAALGAALLFAPDETGRALLPGAGGPAMQVLGAALLGSAAMNWTARGAALGGIYGRAIIMANQTHVTIGALVLLRHGLSAGGSSFSWIVTTFYAVTAVYFSYLTFFSTGLRGK
jgi:hypothetical protein